MAAGAQFDHHGPGWSSQSVRVVLLTLMLLLGGAGAAQAHASVIGSEPSDGAVLNAPPSEVVIHFSEPVSMTHAQVLGPTGEDVLEPGAGQGEDVVTLALSGGLAEGTYIASYHVVSPDGHPISGSLVFSVGRVSGSAPTQDASAAAWRWSFVAAKAVLYLGLFGAAGGVIYTLLAKPAGKSRESGRRIVAGSALLGVAAALVTLGLQGGLLLGGDARALADPATWRAGLASTFGRTAACTVLGLVAIWLGSRPRPPHGSGLLRVAGALLVLGSFALSGHVVTAGPWVLTAPPLLLHMAVTALWAGSLLPLHGALGSPVGESGPLLGRFSKLAIWAVPVLILAGLVMATLQIRHPGALISTEYGQLFLAKMGLAAALLGLATLNRFRLTPALVRGETGAATRLGQSILAEIGLVALIFAVTASLGTTPPPRALVTGGEAEAADLRSHHDHGPPRRALRMELTAPDLTAELIFDPGQLGPNAATLALRDTQGDPVDPLEVTLRLTNPGHGIAPLERQAERKGPGRWRAGDLALAAPGTWEVELDLLISDFERRTLTGRVEVGPPEGETTP